MTRFMGTHQNKLDAKGRVSIPSQFRAVLRPQEAGPVALILRPSHMFGCVEGWAPATFERLTTPIESLDVFSGERDDLAATLYADATPLETDREGRIVLPDSLAAHAGVTETVVFMGMGHHFEIWEPAAAERRRTEARERARAKGLTIPGTQLSNGTPTP